MSRHLNYRRCLRIALVATLGLVGREPVVAAPAAATAAPATVIHRLPFPAGVSYSIFQGNDQGPTHNDAWNKYAYDFSPMAIGSDVCASADGVVTFVKEDTTGPTGRFEDNNEVALLHADGTVSVYVHLMKDGALVEVDQKVYAGDVIAKSGDTGKASGAHLHWCLKQGTRLGAAIPSKFEDVPGDGVPKTGDSATSGNVSMRPLVDAMDRLDAAYGRATKLDCLESMTSVLAGLQKAAPPADVAAALALFQKRDEARALFAERRDALLARHKGGADDAIDALAKARATSQFDTAVAIATFGRLDYATVPTAVAKFQEALAELKKDPGFAKSAYALGPTLAWRRELIRAFDLESKAAEKTAAKKKAGWATIFGIYDGLVTRAPSDGAKKTLMDCVAALKAKVGKAE